MVRCLDLALGSVAGSYFFMKPRALVLCPPELESHVFPSDVLEDIRRAADVAWPVTNPRDPGLGSGGYGDAEVIIGTWGIPTLDRDQLAALPSLKAVFYAAGSVKHFMTEAAWERGVVVCSAWQANSVPVAEYSLGTILLSLKRFWHFSRMSRSSIVSQDGLFVPGAYRSKVGLVSLGAVGRATARLLARFDVSVLAYDPYLHSEQAGELGVTLVSLQELFSKCDVVSLHTPRLAETEGMVSGPLIASMKEGATLINTSRGAVIAENELIEVLAQRPDLTAVLDVTVSEPPPMDSALRSLPNVVLTPHIAGSLQGECARMGRWMAEELQRYCSGEPLRFALNRQLVERMA